MTKRASAGGKATPLPAARWAAMTDTEKMLWTLQRNIDNIRDCVSVPWEEADVATRSLQVRIYEVHMRVAKDMLSESERALARRLALEHIRDEMNGASGGAAAASPPGDEALAADQRDAPSPGRHRRNGGIE